MSISNAVRKAGPYTGNDLATGFTFAFKVFATSDLLVVRAVIATGVETTLTIGTDYTVTLNADQEVSPGGTVTLPAALASTTTLTLTSAVPSSQPTTFTNTGGFYPAVLNVALDRLTILCQQLAEQVGRAVKVPISSAAAATSDYLMGLLNAAVASASGSATAASGSATAASGSATAANNSAIAAAASVSASLPKAGGTMTGAITLAADGVSALHAATVQQVGLAAQQPGEVCFFARTTAPAGFLKANGAAISRTTYAALFAVVGELFGAGDTVTTFNLPDLRGEFFRGLDDGRGIDSGRGLGTAQAGQMPAHTHTYQAELEPTSMYISTEPGYKGRNTGNTGSTGGTENASENRPRNVAFLACIKY